MNTNESIIAPYRPQEFESSWQAQWEKAGIYRASESSSKPKYYCLDYFPYPSGEGLHVGHCRNYVPSDLVARYKRMQGFNVLHPMGWDAFGEPAEQNAIKNQVTPRVTTDRNTANYKRQMRMIGTSYEWEREIDSSDPAYYRWTQWMFLRLYAKGLAYRDTNWQWWCPTCATTLSSHEIQGERCWRGHLGVTKVEIPAWYFKITSYADELISGLTEVDWPEAIVRMQTHWIGRSEGTMVHFNIREGDADADWASSERITTFTTRPDTIYGVTFLVLAPEHPLVDYLTTPNRRAEVKAYREAAIQRGEIARCREGDEKDGVFTGGYGRHPLTGEQLPVYVADYVLGSVGSGAVMGVPAHDQRDYDFALKYGLKIQPVIEPADGERTDAAYEGHGRMMHSGLHDGICSEAAGTLITAALESAGRGGATVQYRMRDWLISRQRYWGTPIPVVHCPVCGVVPVPEAELPVLLPEMEDFAPDGSGRSPLARVDSFVNTSCPQCGGAAQRETDTMGGFACSSWYFLRFTSPDYQAGPFDPQRMVAWMPVDLYVGGAEHAVLHLLYARFWTKFLADEGLVPFREPFTRLVNQGQLHGPDGSRMSKSRGNVIVPDDLVAAVGADSVRVYCLFMAPFEQNVDWNPDGINGAWRFLNRVWNLVLGCWDTDCREVGPLDPDLECERHKFVRDVTERMEGMRFNTLISALMEFTNHLYERASEGSRHGPAFQHCLETLLVLMAPVAPYITEELWSRTGHGESIHLAGWPDWDEDKVRENEVSLPVQVNGRKRATIQMPENSSQKAVLVMAMAQPEIAKLVSEGEISRVVYVPGKILNIVCD